MPILICIAIGTLLYDVIFRTVLAWFGIYKLKPFTCVGCTCFWVAVAYNFMHPGEVWEMAAISAASYYGGIVFFGLFKTKIPLAK